MAKFGWPTVDVISESIRALDDGRFVPEVICLGLAHVLPASAAAFVRLDRRLGRCAIISWSEDVGWAAVSDSPREQEAIAQAGRCQATEWHWRQTVAFDLLGDIARSSNSLEMELARTPQEERLAVFCRRRPFGDREVRILAQCQSVMTAIDRHAWLLGSESATHAVVSPCAGQRAAFTTREMEVLAWLCQGAKARTIARRLAISERTVNKHLANIYRKLGAHDRLVAVSKAQSLGVLPDPSTLADSRPPRP